MTFFIMDLVTFTDFDVSGRWRKKLNFLIEFSNSIFIKFDFKPFMTEAVII